MKTTLIPVTLLVALFTTVVWWQGGRIDAANEQIGQSSQRIADLAKANESQAAQLKQAATERAQAYALLQQLGTRLDEIAQQTNRSTHVVKESLAPIQGRPNCRDEPLPAAALRVLQQPIAGNGGAASAGTAPGRTDAPLP
ncbi:hypothetical protein JD504_03420 [Aeromonas hydrophila]|uniref:hypothetical protein n=1 Tax=Aeromonas hydrophila TaxID=644 RepID=UPI0019200B13|nr:hypothetical protein [Aeromonas hydrophila]MBL0669809.1 hypothetical protein [Aeromonas hydrophila]